MEEKSKNKKIALFLPQLGEKQSKNANDPSGIRTPDTLIKSQVLYRLS